MGSSAIQVVSPPTPGTGMVTYSTALLDCTATVDNVPFSEMPLRPGFLFISRIYTVTIHDGSGTATGNMIWSAGNDGSHQNVLGPVTTTSVTINNLVPTAPYQSFGNGGGTGAVTDAGTAIVLKIVTAPTGVTALHCYFTVHGFWVPK